MNLVSKKDTNVSANESDQNLTYQAFENIRHDILICRLKPDARLPLDELRERYQVGATPLREALMRLTSDGLVVFEQNRGFRVAAVSRDDLVDAVEIQIELNMIALRKSIELGDDEWEGNLISSFHRLSKQSKLSPDAEVTEMDSRWSQRHREFHDTLVSACGSKWLVNFYEVITDQTNRYLRLSVEYLEQPRDDNSEHREIMEAALERDSDKACRSLSEHLLRTRDKLLQIEPTIFGD